MSYYRGSALALAATLIMAQPASSQEIKIGLSGTFTGTNCAPAPGVINPAGTWNATKQ